MYLHFDLAAKPFKNCGGPNPLHPLYVCNGEKDCPNGRDETNCTQGTIFSPVFNLHLQYSHCFVLENRQAPCENVGSRRLNVFLCESVSVLVRRCSDRKLDASQRRVALGCGISAAMERAS